MRKRNSASSSRPGSRIGALALLAAACLAACVGGLPRLSPAQIDRAARRWPGTTPGDLEQGRSLYVTKCSACHTLRLPSRYPARRWPAIMDSMQKQARLSDDAKELILRYLLSAADTEGATGGP